MTGHGVVRRSATLSDTRASAAATARRSGVPPTMVDSAAARREAGDWRGACAAAGVALHLPPDSVRRRHGADMAERLLADLRVLAPDLLRWHFPRCGHGSGRLLEGLLVPLAGYSDDPDDPAMPPRLTLVAATPPIALVAGERIVLTVVESGRSRPTSPDPVVRAVLDAVHVRSAERHDLRRHRMFWDSGAAAGLSGLCPDLVATADARAGEITELQDAGDAPQAWSAAGFSLVEPGGASRWTTWLSALPVNLPGLADRVRTLLPGSGQAVIRSGGGAVVLSGLDRRGTPPIAEAVPGRQVRGVPVVPAAAWTRPLDADLLRLGILRPGELHPLVAAALLPDRVIFGAEPDGWLYATVPGAEEHRTEDGVPTVVVRCGAERHRVMRRDAAWQPVDHDGQPGREALLARLGGPEPPCRAAARHLGGGRHVAELVESLLAHGRTDDAVRLLREHGDGAAPPETFVLSDGTKAGDVLARLHENDLRLRMLLAGAVPARPAHPVRISAIRRSRKGEPARTPR